MLQIGIDLFVLKRLVLNTHTNTKTERCAGVHGRCRQVQHHRPLCGTDCGESVRSWHNDDNCALTVPPIPETYRRRKAPVSAETYYIDLNKQKGTHRMGFLRPERCSIYRKGRSVFVHMCVFADL